MSKVVEFAESPYFQRDSVPSIGVEGFTVAIETLRLSGAARAYVEECMSRVSRALQVNDLAKRLERIVFPGYFVWEPNYDREAGRYGAPSLAHKKNVSVSVNGDASISIEVSFPWRSFGGTMLDVPLTEEEVADAKVAVLEDVWTALHKLYGCVFTVKRTEYSTQYSTEIDGFPVTIITMDTLGCTLMPTEEVEDVPDHLASTLKVVGNTVIQEDPNYAVRDGKVVRVKRGFRSLCAGKEDVAEAKASGYAVGE